MNSVDAIGIVDFIEKNMILRFQKIHSRFLPQVGLLISWSNDGRNQDTMRFFEVTGSHVF